MKIKAFKKSLIYMSPVLALEKNKKRSKIDNLTINTFNIVYATMGKDSKSNMKGGETK